MPLPVLERVSSCTDQGVIEACRYLQCTLGSACYPELALNKTLYLTPVAGQPSSTINTILFLMTEESVNLPLEKMMMDPRYSSCSFC